MVLTFRRKVDAEAKDARASSPVDRGRERRIFDPRADGRSIRPNRCASACTKRRSREVGFIRSADDISTRLRRCRCKAVARRLLTGVARRGRCSRPPPRRRSRALSAVTLSRDARTRAVALAHRLVATAKIVDIPLRRDLGHCPIDATPRSMASSVSAAHRDWPGRAAHHLSRGRRRVTAVARFRTIMWIDSCRRRSAAMRPWFLSHRRGAVSPHWLPAGEDACKIYVKSGRDGERIASCTQKFIGSSPHQRSTSKTRS